MASAMLEPENMVLINDEKQSQSNEETVEVSYAQAAGAENNNNDNKNNNQDGGQETYKDRDKRTFIFYNLHTSDDMKETILKSLSDHFKAPAVELVQRIQRNTRFRSRYNVTFFKLEHFQALFEHGMTINGIKIKGQSEKRKERRQSYGNSYNFKSHKKRLIKFFAPNLPACFNSHDVAEMLCEKGYNPKFVREKTLKNYDIPTGQYHIDFFENDIIDDDFIITYNEVNYKFLSISKMADNRRRTAPSNDQLPADDVAKETITTQETNQQGIPREENASSSHEIAEGNPPDVDFEKTGARPRTSTKTNETKESPKQEKKTPTFDRDPLGIHYGPTNQEYSYELSPAEKIHLKQLENKKGNLTNKEAIIQQEYLNRESITAMSTRIPSPSATTPASGNLIIDETHEDTMSVISQSSKRSHVSDSSSNSNDTIKSALRKTWEEEEQQLGSDEDEGNMEWTKVKARKVKRKLKKQKQTEKETDTIEHEDPD